MRWYVDPSTRLPFTRQNFASYLLPAISLYVLTAYLTLRPGTHRLRICLLPITFVVAVRAAISLDFSLTKDGPDHGLIYWNFGLGLGMFTLCMRAVEWTLNPELLRRVSTKTHLSETNGHAVDVHKTPPLTRAMLDALDLCTNLRGLDWPWSKKLRIPSETRPTDSRIAFAFATASQLFRHWILADSTQYSIQYLFPDTVGSTAGGTIFDPDLPPLQRYLQSLAITLTAGFCVYGNIQTFYDLATLIGVLVFQQRPSQWPPIFDQPWKAECIAEFWSWRWHQVFRRSFIVLGAKPLSLLVGRVGSALGAFVISGILHDCGMWGMGRGTDPQRVALPFVMMGVGALLEHAFQAATGRRVSGFPGNVWTMAWTTAWCQLMVDAWCRRGLVGSRFVPNSMRPLRRLILFLRGSVPA